MFRTIAAASLAALSLCVTPAAAQDSSPFVDHFKTMCADGQGDGPRALGLALSAGWAKLPPEMFNGDDTPFDQITAMMNAENDDTVVILMTGTMTQDVEGAPMKMSVCAVMGGNMETGESVKPDPLPIVRDWIGLDTHPDFSEDGREGYAFTQDEGGRRTAIRSDAVGMQAALTGRLHVVVTGGEDGMAMIMYLRPIFTTSGN